MTYQLIGLFLFIIGFSHKALPAHQLESSLVTFLQQKLGRNPYLAWFEELWPLGRTSFSLIVLLLLTVYRWELGLSALAVFGVVAGIEKIVKITFMRGRPFSAHPAVRMLQPHEPVDPSFPSGDALRIWFLALILTIALGNNLPFGILSAMLAALVSLGRIVLGVHFLTDVLSGAGLGFLAAGTTIWLWQTFNLL